MQGNAPEICNQSKQILFIRTEESSERCYQQGMFRVKDDGGKSLQVPYDATDLSESDAEVVQQLFLQPKKLQLCGRTR